MTSTALVPSKVPYVELALLLVLATLWGASYTLIKVAVETVPPLTLMAVRTVIASAILWALVQARGIAIPRDFATWRKFMFQATMNSVLPFTLIAWAEQTVTAGVATIINSAAPILTFLLSWLLLGQAEASLRKLFGTIAGLAGIVLLIGLDALRGFEQGVLAQFALVAATLCYAVAAIYGRNFKGLDSMLPAAGSLLCGAIVLVPASLLFDRPWDLAPSVESMVAIVLLAVFSTALAFVIYFRLIKTLGPVGTTSQAYLRVPIGVFAGVLILGEPVAGSAMIGLVLVVAGVAAITIPRKKPA